MDERFIQSVIGRQVMVTITDQGGGTDSFYAVIRGVQGESSRREPEYMLDDRGSSMRSCIVEPMSLGLEFSFADCVDPAQASDHHAYAVMEFRRRRLEEIHQDLMVNCKAVIGLQLKEETEERQDVERVIIIPESIHGENRHDGRTEGEDRRAGSGDVD